MSPVFTVRWWYHLYSGGQIQCATT